MARASRCFCFETARVATAGLIGCGSAIFSATRAAIPTGQSIPGAMMPSTDSADGEPLDALLVLGRDDRPPVRIPETRRPGIAVERDHEQTPLAGCREQAELRRPGP